MVEEIFQNLLSQMAKKPLNCPPWLEKILKFVSQMAKNALKLSTMVGENLGILWSQMSTNTLKFIFRKKSMKIVRNRMETVRFL